MIDAVPRRITDYWRAAFGGRVVATGPGLTLTANAALAAARPAMILERSNDRIQATVTPALAATIAPGADADLSVALLQTRLAHAGIALHDPDYLFYAPETAPAAADARADGVRRLTIADHAAFAAFEAEAPPQDLEDAFVLLDHDAVFGRFEGGRLVSAASLCRWKDGLIADLGVLTLPDARGRGHGRAVVTAIARFARQQGLEPQYRCQIDNHASVALARACGLIAFGRWRVAADQRVPATGPDPQPSA
jgi:GNAT superfamily N-acetyltransferase